MITNNGAGTNRAFIKMDIQNPFSKLRPSFNPKVFTDKAAAKKMIPSKQMKKDVTKNRKKFFSRRITSLEVIGSFYCMLCNLNRKSISSKSSCPKELLLGIPGGNNEACDAVFATAIDALLQLGPK